MEASKRRRLSENNNEDENKNEHQSVCHDRSKSEIKKKKPYDEDTIQKAMQALEDSDNSIRKIASIFNIPVSTLARRVSNPTKYKPGPSTVLPKEMEADIANWILFRAKRGYPVSRAELLDSVKNFIVLSKKSTPFVESRPGRHWYEGFMKRHSNLTVRKEHHLNPSRAEITIENLKKWFDNQEKYLISKNLFDISSDRVFNCGESDIQLSPDKFITVRESRLKYKIGGSNEEGITVLFMYCASGLRVPPLVMDVYKKNIRKKKMKNTGKTSDLGILDRMKTETFYYEYFKNIFYPWVVTKNIEFPIIVYFDNYSFQASIPLIAFCKEKNIKLTALHSDPTHIMEPLKIAFFNPLKTMLKKAILSWKSENDGKELRREDFANVLKNTLNSMDEKTMIQNGFNKSGLMPFNFNAINDVLNKGNNTDSDEVIIKDRFGCTNNDEVIIKNEIGCTDSDKVIIKNEIGCTESDKVVIKKEIGCTDSDGVIIKVETDATESYEDIEEIMYDQIEDYKFLEKLNEMLPPGVLDEFNTASRHGVWSGDIEKKTLFELWLRAKKAASGGN